MSILSSCLVRNLSYYLELDDDELELVAGFEEEERSYPSGTRIRSMGDPSDLLFAVKSGWLITSIDLPDGRRQIVRICVPGDLIGLGDIGFEHATQDLTACNDVVLCPFPKRGLKPTLESAPRLSALLMSLAAQELVITVDLLRAVGRMASKERVAYLLLQILFRLRVTVGSSIDGFDLPLSLTDLGDTVGLTNVSVSKAMCELERSGDIQREFRKVRLTAPDRLKRHVDFTERYTVLDTCWFPE